MSINEHDPVVGQIGARLPEPVGIPMALAEALEPLKELLRQHQIRNLNISLGEMFTITSIVIHDGKNFAILEVPRYDGTMSERSFGGFKS